MSYDIYLYGMILQSTAFLLKDTYPVADTYGEISKKYRLTGGETGTAATVLASLGCTIKMDGNYLGRNTKDLIQRFYAERGVDISRMTYDESFEGLEDYILIDQNTRTCFGTFNEYFTNGLKRWNLPMLEDILKAKAVGIDPFIEEGALLGSRLCVQAGVPYVTIDCRYNSELSQNAAINALSNEFISSTYKDADRVELLKAYAEHSKGLIIFTHGGKDLMYMRRGGEVKYMPAFKAEVVSTLGAGDTFKAGCVYALYKGMSDEDTVRFAAATAASAVEHFPIPLDPPTLERIHRFID
ncbi:PfkB family carbohydrate kinase [Acetanaerobacterium elongatum]|uniref:Sugar or nucleoside kinase, ribokinase family n=1 Tax=Acetanaerobacterium elongatum TaxID=258515 RepID=A0A1H0GTF8_9FIRM|nr:PfkB family carbohydrate kinase [Acetanaerobacterium elongatum]SDO10139.1 Sugar or nucleoside kinase, ribokinase family [Acetanaerobacterium elongatum]